MNELFGYEGKKVVINGAASGMGEAATRLLVDLGAEIYALDIKEVKLPVKKYIHTDLSKKELIDAALVEIPGNVDRVFTCAGVPGPPFTPIQTVMVNFVGNRYMVEALLPRVVDGGAVSMISSIAGQGWQAVLKVLDQFIAITGFEQSRAWLEAHPEVLRSESRDWIDAHPGEASPSQDAAPYAFSKQCLVAYVKSRAWELAKRKIRINTLSPGDTATPMMTAFHAAYTKEGIDMMVTPIDRYATPQEMGGPLVFLNSDMASYISGLDMVVDFGFAATAELRGIRER